MARGWFGLGILILFLGLGIVTSQAMETAHTPTQKLLQQAADMTLEGNLEDAIPLAMQAKNRWERHWNGTASVADHSPMDEVDALFGELEIYAQAEEKPHLAAVCQELAQRIQAFIDAHRFSWWNVL